MTNLPREQLYFGSIKENRDSYFVEYHPPVSNKPVATLNLVYPSQYDLKEVARSMRSEMEHWIKRYPIPVMVSAFDAADNVLRPNDPHEDGFLVGWFVPGTRELASSWKLSELPAFLNDTTNREQEVLAYRRPPSAALSQSILTFRTKRTLRSRQTQTHT